MAKEYIEREAAISKIQSIQGPILSREVRALSELPAADVVEVVHGRNLKEDTPSLFECSICNWCSYDTLCGNTEDYNFCPNCGARMDGGEDAY